MVRRPEVELATSPSRVRHANHYTIKPPKVALRIHNCTQCFYTAIMILWLSLRENVDKHQCKQQWETLSEIQATKRVKIPIIAFILESAQKSWYYLVSCLRYVSTSFSSEILFVSWSCSLANLSSSCARQQIHKINSLPIKYWPPTVMKKRHWIGLNRV